MENLTTIFDRSDDKNNNTRMPKRDKDDDFDNIDPWAHDMNK